MRKFEVSLNFEMLKSLERTKYLFDTQTGRFALGKKLVGTISTFCDNSNYFKQAAVGFIHRIRDKLYQVIFSI